MSDSENKGYQVLARKYRPSDFADLIGQDAMVRTLKNAFEAGRISHAFVMTGVRGVGKTTTARIIAKGMNCIGKDGQGGPTVEPCGECEPCRSIAEGTHVDVMEMDAASRTGVGDIREIIDAVRYRAASARYKIYIIDEVHMLSTNAFNALLKTLEEPPEHVKFIFATTEIRKIPVTVLSRCQRFDLRRIEPEVMIEHLNKISDLEGAQIAPDALALITRAAEGSVRDALSLLDQAIAHGAGETTADQVRAMLGLADRGRVLDLFELIMKGEVGAALSEISGQYADGADPIAVLRDLAEITHWVSVIKISPDAAEDPTVSPEERERGLQFAEGLPMRVLTRTWQMLLKSIDEVSLSPNAMMAAEMAIIRMTHVSELPSPSDLIRKLQANPPAAQTGPTPAGAGTGGAAQSSQAIGQSSGVAMPTQSIGDAPTPSGGPSMSTGAGATALAQQPQSEQALARFPDFQSVVDLIRARRDLKLLVEVETVLRLAKYSPGRIEFQPTDKAPQDLAPRLAQRLQLWTGTRWAVSVVTSGGGDTISEIKDAERDDLVGQVRQHSLVAAALSAFPNAEIRDIRSTEEISDPEMPLSDGVDDDWDPFEDD